MPQTLNRWEEIASFLHTGVSTAQRWEREYGLPIHRAGNAQALVFAFPAELQYWLQISGSSDAYPPGSPHTTPVQPRELKKNAEHHMELVAKMESLIHVQRQQVAKLKNERLKFRSYLLARQSKVDHALARRGRILVEAQEQERMRIARDLHDDINQRLALAAIMVDEIQQHPELPAELCTRHGELQKQITDISTDVHAVAFELHPSSLEYLGIVAALRSLCNGFAQRRGIEIKFTDQDVPKFPPPDVSHCLFRVLQEALNNATRHSGAKHMEVMLRGGRGDLHLIISDSGMGFDIKTAWKGQGLGLTSMQERVRLLNGTLLIRSKPMAGTTVHACVPTGSESKSQISASTTPSLVM